MKILVVAPHADDETLGAGGAMARFASEGHEVHVAVMTGHGEQPHPLWPPEAWDTIRREAREACDRMGVSRLIFKDIPAVLAPDLPAWKLNRAAQETLEECAPEMLLLPFPGDMHGDHRALFHAFSVAYRPVSAAGRGVKEIYVYETASETHWNFAAAEAGFVPDVFVDISAHLKTKLEAFSCYRSQVKDAPHARSLEALHALATWRGSLVGVAAAEAFMLVRRLI